jgi:predicted ATP-grasp superfamily ATP-dependent carboligase
LTEYLWQPFVAGGSYSVAALVRPGHAPDILPVAEQQLTTDGEFRYLGGCVPANLSENTARMIRSLMLDLIASLAGLNGYIGVDLIVPDDGDPLFVELNPRLTSSYIGYRQLCEDNLMERLLFPQRAVEPLRWKPGVVTFDSAGSGLLALDSRL